MVFSTLVFGRSTIKTKIEDAKIYQVMLAIKWSLQHIEHINGVFGKKNNGENITSNTTSGGNKWNTKNKKINMEWWYYFCGHNNREIMGSKCLPNLIGSIAFVDTKQRNHGQHVFATFDVINYNSETKLLDQRRQEHWCLMWWSLSFTTGYVAFTMNVCWLRIIIFHGPCKKIL